jgi:hypothetical protein
MHNKYSMRLMQQDNIALKKIYSTSDRPECPVRGVSKDDEKRYTLRYFFASKKTQGERGKINFFNFLIKSIYALFFFAFFHISFGQSYSRLVTCTTTDIDHHTKDIIITFIIPEKDYIYKDFITCSVHEPTVTLSSWKANKQVVNHYDPSFKETKQIFNETFSISMIATTKKYSSDPVYLCCSYYRRSEKKINHILYALFFPQPIDSNEQIDTTATDLSTNIMYKKIIPSHISAIDDYFFIFLHIGHRAIASLQTDHKKYFALLILLILFLMLFSYFFKEPLQKKTTINELLEILRSLLILATTAYALVCLHTISTPLITMIMACLCTMYAGFFYIKKSTKLQTGYLRTLCTFIGIFCICSALLLSFKALQYADEQFHLL